MEEFFVSSIVTGHSLLLSQNDPEIHLHNAEPLELLAGVTHVILEDMLKPTSRDNDGFYRTGRSL